MTTKQTDQPGDNPPGVGGKPWLPGPLAARWGACSPREKRALLGMALVLGVALVVQAGWSLQEARSRLLRGVPRQAAEVVRMDAALESWRKLTRTPGAPSLDGAAQQREMNRRMAELAAKAGGRVNGQWSGQGSYRLTGSVPFDLWVAWLAEVQHELHLVPTQVKLVTEAGGWGPLEAELSDEAQGR